MTISLSLGLHDVPILPGAFWQVDLLHYSYRPLDL